MPDPQAFATPCSGLNSVVTFAIVIGALVPYQHVNVKKRA
jgi:hypothetical protein